MDARPLVIEPAALDDLLEALRRRGFTPVGPTVRAGAIVHAELQSAGDLPAGWTDVQDGGTYRLERREDGALFGHNLGPESWKRELFPPTLRLWRSHRTDEGFEVEPQPAEPPRFAFIGVRSCDLHAIAVQDRIFMEGAWADRDYEARRGGAFIVALNCGKAGGTCFCVSMGTGPKAESGFDLALTELLDGGHRLLVELGTERGAELMAEVPHREAGPADERAGDEVVERTAAQMGRTMDVTDIRDLLLDNLDHPRWDDVASRCLSCGNCTMVCPTCFCSTVDDHTDLAGEEAERVRRWDSCFTLEHSYIHGGSVRPNTRSRYRQWMTHKLSSWIDQFGTSGCVGCGRCITWCPVAIDITEEVAAIRATTEQANEDDR